MPKRSGALPCLKPHPKFELVLFHLNSRGERKRMVKSWPVTMTEDHPGPDRKELLEVMDACYDAKLSCNCENCKGRT